MDISDKLEFLFEREGFPSNEKIAKKAGLTESYVRHLRKGKKKNPTQKALNSLAAAFDVNPAYFLSNVSENAAANMIVTRAHELDEADANWILNAMEAILDKYNDIGEDHE